MKYSDLILLSTLTATLAMAGCGSNSGGNDAPKPAPGAFEKNVNPSCSNSITVDDLGARQELKTTRKGRYTLLSMEMYVVSSKGDSLRATANENSAFRIQVDCNGVSSDMNLQGSLSAATEINTLTMMSPLKNRDMSVSIKAGQLEEAISELVDSSGGTKLDVDAFPKGRFQSGDVFMTINIISVDSTQINVTMKMENADLVEYGQFVYRLR